MLKVYTDYIFLCVYEQRNTDFVKVYSCTTIACPSPVELASLSGTYLTPQSVTSYTGIIKVTFTSDGSVVSSGFAGVWTSVSVRLLPVQSYGP